MSMTGPKPKRKPGPKPKRYEQNFLNPYRRHADGCKLAPRDINNCSCPIWTQGRLNGKPVRRTLKTRNQKVAWSKIETLLQAKSTDALAGPEEEPGAALTIQSAITDFLDWCETNQRLKPSTLVSYRATLIPFEAFCAERNYRCVNQLNLKIFEMWQASRKVTPKTAEKEFTHLQSLCSRLLRQGSLQENFAKHVKLVPSEGVSTLPFREAEAKAILAACSRLGEQDRKLGGGYSNFTADQIDEARRWARALILMLLATGLRISDVINLERDSVFTDRNGITRLRIRTEKTGVLLTLALPTAAVATLNQLPKVSARYYFFKESALPITAQNRARRVIRQLGKLAQVENAHPHRFRDTWAKEALLAGTSMRTVQLVLGHKSIITTEMHYAPFVPEYQAQIDAATDAVANRLIA
jgi:integrase